jgi:hypothetical protein
MRVIIENPAPLNPFRAFPYKVSPFPFDWLRQFTTLDDDADPETAPAQPLESLESWT